MNFLVLGSGNAETERGLEGLLSQAMGDYNVFIGYNEALSHMLCRVRFFINAIKG